MGEGQQEAMEHFLRGLTDPDPKARFSMDEAATHSAIQKPYFLFP